MSSVKRGVLRSLAWALVEMGAVVFLFYANLLMGEFTRDRPAGQGLWPALRAVVTPENFAIALVAALVAHLVFGTLRERLSGR